MHLSVGELEPVRLHLPLIDLHQQPVIIGGEESDLLEQPLVLDLQILRLPQLEPQNADLIQESPVLRLHRNALLQGYLILHQMPLIDDAPHNGFVGGFRRRLTVTRHYYYIQPPFIILKEYYYLFIRLFPYFIMGRKGKGGNIWGRQIMGYNQLEVGPVARQKSWIRLMAFRQAAVLRSHFLAIEVAITYSVAEVITSSSPDSTMLYSVAPSRSSSEAQVKAFSFMFTILLTTSITFFLDFSSHFLFSLPGLTWSRFFNHSKYDAVTPPALQRMSGRNLAPLANRISSALMVVGPLAASTINLVSNFPALNLLMVFSKAAGMKKSTFLQIADSSGKYSAPGNPLTPLLATLQLFKASKSIPLGLKILPSASATPTSFAPAPVKYLEAQYPTLPNPWIENVFPAIPGATPNSFARVGFSRIVFVTKNTPSPVDYFLPLIPPWFRAFPVTQPAALISK